MSKNKPKKSAKPEEKLNAKEHDDEKNKEEEDQPGDGGRKPQPAEEKWSDWIWDEEMKLYYRAKHGTGGEDSLPHQPPSLLINDRRRMDI